MSKRSDAAAKSDEHVIPLWLQTHLGITGNPVNPMRVRTDDRAILDARQHVMGAFKSGTVCHDCNHGWMAQLEVDAKPTLVRLIRDPHELSRLTDEERFVVARWTFKTAAVFNRCSTYGDPFRENFRPVPDAHVRKAQAEGVPDGVTVLGAVLVSTSPFNFLQYAVWSAPKSQPLREEDRNLSYKIAFAFRDLVLIIAFYPGAYAYGANQNHYIPLFVGNRRLIPINHLMIDAPPDSFTPGLEGLLRNVYVVSET